MPRLVIVCRNEECADGVAKRPQDPKPMICTGETHSAWTFVCDSCRSLRVVTKDIAGGSFGTGRKDDGSGTTTGKGPSRFRFGVG